MNADSDERERSSERSDGLSVSVSFRVDGHVSRYPTRIAIDVMRTNRPVEPVGGARAVQGGVENAGPTSRCGPGDSRAFSTPPVASELVAHLDGKMYLTPPNKNGGLSHIRLAMSRIVSYTKTFECAHRRRSAHHRSVVTQSRSSRTSRLLKKSAPRDRQIDPVVLRCSQDSGRERHHARRR